MALKLQLTSDSPGYGRLSIQNLAAADELQLSFQRSSDRNYLWPGQQWQANTHWFAVSGIEASGDSCNCLLGPEIIDGLITSSNEAILVSLQGGAGSGQGVMRVVGRLLGSDAAGATAQAPKITGVDTRVPMDAGEDETSNDENDDGSEDGQSGEGTEPPSPPPDPPASSRRWLWVLLGILLLIAALAAALYLDLLKLPDISMDSDTTDTPAEQKTDNDTPVAGSDGDVMTEQEVPAPTAGSDAGSTPPGLRGRARAQNLLGKNIAPEAMFDQAGGWEREGDCEAAMIVYQIAAQSDTDAAVRYARRYDPDTIDASGCIKTADTETAAYWYQGPAEAGDVEAQRQLGKILVENYDTGVLRDQGEDWLNKAARAGDAEAGALVEKLGIDDN